MSDKKTSLRKPGTDQSQKNLGGKEKEKSGLYLSALVGFVMSDMDTE